MNIELIYCADGNARYAEIAIAAGFLYGAQLPNSVHHPVYFADQDWHHPDRSAYMTALAEHHPEIASVIDWEDRVPLSEVLGWAEDAAAYVQTVIIIPKVVGGIPSIPSAIGGKPIRLGYAVGTKSKKFKGTPVPTWEFRGRPVHLLGGSPEKQMRLELYLNVVSADCNMMMKQAHERMQFWVSGTARQAKNRFWPQLKEVGDGGITHDATYEAFGRSCVNIRAAWSKIGYGIPS